MQVHKSARNRTVLRWLIRLAALCPACIVAPTVAQELPAPEYWAIHGQTTIVWQYHPAFRSPYAGANSLDGGSRGNETFDATLYAGVRPWSGAEIWFNGEIDQGFGLSNTLGVAGFPSGEAYKVGKSEPYFRLQRLFFRQTFSLGGDIQYVEPGVNQLGRSETTDTLVVTIGKISAVDIFDTNSYAHDPRADFLNWAVIDSGAYDYAADAWGYTYGITGEWTQAWWTLRAGLFDLSRIPNTTALETDFNQFELVAEVEERHEIWGAPGKLKLLAYVNRGRMGSYTDAVRLAQMTGNAPDTALVREYSSQPGIVLNFEQQVDQDLGIFARASLNQGSKEAYEFTDINKSLSVGFSLAGGLWGRPQDVFGLAGVANGLLDDARAYFAAGGLGILIGDGQLPNYASEHILEAYYSATLTSWLWVSADYQWIQNPAYNSDRGPVSIIATRVHLQY